MGKASNKFLKENKALVSSVASYFKMVGDPRNKKNRKHELWVLLTLVLIGMLKGCRSIRETVRYLERKEKTLSKILPLSSGIPSHCTLSRILQQVHFGELKFIFLLWIGDILKGNSKEKGHLMIDGKGLRAANPEEERKTPYVLNALLRTKGIELFVGMLRVGAKSNEIPSIVPLLEVIDIKEKVVTLDAIGTQVKVMEQIEKQGGSFVLPIKANKKVVLSNIEDHIRLMEEAGEIKTHKAIDKGHGRIDIRTIKVAPNRELSKEYDKILSRAKYSAKVLRERIKEKEDITTVQEVFYLSSHLGEAEELGEIIRGHWKVESSHWILDEHFAEDRCTAKKGYSLENLALLRRIAFNLFNLINRDKKRREGFMFDSTFTSWSMIKKALFEPLAVV